MRQCPGGIQPRALERLGLDGKWQKCVLEVLRSCWIASTSIGANTKFSSWDRLFCYCVFSGEVAASAAVDLGGQEKNILLDQFTILDPRGA